MIRWLFWTAWEWSLIAAALWMAAQWPWLIPVAVLVIGSRQHALGVLGHEIVHRTVPVPEWVVNVVAMWPIGTSVAGYRAFHLPHHRYLGTDKDPETHLKRRFAHRYNPSASLRWRLLTMDFLGLNAHEALILMRIVWGPTPIARVAHGVVALAALSLLSWWAPLVWIFALFSSFWMVHRMRTWREHYVDGDGVMQTYRLPCPWWMRWAYPHYIWKHKDHHAPGRGRVPCWELRG
jgi:fatty acid desaturase